MVQEAMIILYVSDQSQSTIFYSKLLRAQPVLHVPGMTEFVIFESLRLGLMPNSGIKKILSNRVPDPADGNGIPRCELYFRVKDVDEAFENACACGALLVSPIEDRDWGERVCYFADPDGHIIAFAGPLR